MNHSTTDAKALEGSEADLLDALAQTEKSRTSWLEQSKTDAQNALDIQNETADPLEHHRADQAFQRSRRSRAILENT